MDKPLIRLTGGGSWMCRQTTKYGNFVGLGATPEEAYTTFVKVVVLAADRNLKQALERLELAISIDPKPGSIIPASFELPPRPWWKFWN